MSGVVEPSLEASAGLEPADGAEASEKLEGSVRRGLGWSVVNTVTSRLGSLIAAMVLARLLTPQDYGAYAVATVVLAAVLSFNELGVSLAIVRWPEDPAKIGPTVNTVSALLSCLLFLGCTLSAPYLAALLNAPAATPMIRVVSVCVLIDGVTASSAAMIARGLHQDRRFAADLAGFLMGTVLSVVLAILGFGAWSMIWGLMMANVISAITTLTLAPRRFGFGWDRDITRRLVRFGLPLAGSSLLLFVMLNVDYILVGHLAGAEALGLYLIAFNLASWPVNIISATVRRVSLAAFSRAAADPVRLRSAFLRGLTLVLTAALLICLPLGLLAHSVLRVLYGAQWTGAAQALGLLCVFSAGRILAEYAYDYFIASDRNHFNLILQGVWLAALAPSLALGIRWAGINGAAAAQALVVVVVVIPLLFAGLGGAIPWPDLLRAARRPLLTAFPPVVACLLIGLVIDQPLLLLLLGGAVTTLGYAIANKDTLLDIRRSREAPVV